MLKNENIICISSIDWDFIWQGHQEIMSTLAASGNRVIFIENTGVRAPSFRDLPRIKKRFLNWCRGVGGIRKEKENLYVFSPLVIPLPYSRFARWINKHLLWYSLSKWMKATGFNDPIVWTFLPTGLVLDLIRYIYPKITVYYCIDSFVESSPQAHKIESTEKKVIKTADLVFVTSRKLYEHCLPYNDKVHIFPFGVNIEKFRRTVHDNNHNMPDDLKGVQKPIVGYIGGVHKWIDKDLIKDLADSCPECSFVFVGPIQTGITDLYGRDNVYFLKNKPHQQLPEYVRNFDVCIIPYLLTEYTKNVYPTKLNEYLAAGKPVVSTDLPEIEIFNRKYKDPVFIGKDPEGFRTGIKEAVSGKHTENIISERVRIAEDNTWQKRIEEMAALITNTVERNIHDKALIWEKQLKRVYGETWRRLVKITIAALLSYLLIFHTSFLWLVAKPLKIDQTPKQADVIAVFAGGVGESGQPGQGYEERVMHAASLYKKGYAENIIFSSAYTYALKEVDMMKVLAVFLGVPEEHIFLENDAVNTFQNVKHTKLIMEEHGWGSALIVSSPYHMRRVQLVCKKIAPGLRMVFVPVPNSVFYGGEGKIEIKHIKAIIHEYLGIIYYFTRGYI